MVFPGCPHPRDTSYLSPEVSRVTSSGIASGIPERRQRVERHAQAYLRDMPNEDGEYTEDEIPTHKPEPCSRCKSPQRVTKWHRVSPNVPGPSLYLPGLLACTNPKCTRNTG